MYKTTHHSNALQMDFGQGFHANLSLDTALALPQDAACATKIPRPGAFLPVQASKGQQP